MIGRTISHYKILEKLGEGGMGVVYKAEDTTLGRQVALKFLSAQVISGDADESRFAREAKAAASLSHPNVATIYEFGGVDDLVSGNSTSFIAMEFVDGQTLAHMIGERPLPVHDVLDIATAVAEALSKAHEKGIVHRDIKPENIMLTRDGVVKVMDFGLADIAGRSRVTREGTTVGTVAYMSPEQARGERVDNRSDLWSYGVVLYEMLTGKRPFAASYEQALVYQILNDSAEPVTSLRSNVPMEFERIITKLMQKRPADRYQSAVEIIVDLRALRKQLDSGTREHIPAAPDAQATSPSRSIRRTSLIVGSIILVLATTAGTYFYFHAQTKSGNPIRSIAVLPLDNLSKNKEQDWFVDGMTEALTAEISNIGALSVRSRTSTAQYKGTTKSLPEIARELHVDALIEGSALQIGNRVRITAQLIDANDRHLWAKEYDGGMEDVLSLHRDISRAIAREINVALSPSEQARLTEPSPVVPAALEAHLRGRQAFSSDPRGDGVHRAIDYFQQAVAIDTTFAQAYADLASAFLSLMWNGEKTPLESWDLAEGPNNKALQINPQLPLAHLNLFYHKYVIGWNWTGARESIERARELSPNDADVLYTLTDYYVWSGQFARALEVSSLLKEQEPGTAGPWVNRAYAQYHGGDFDASLRTLEEALALFPNTGTLHDIRSWNLTMKQRHPEAVKEARKAISLMRANPGVHAMAGWVFARAGLRSDALKEVDTIKALGRRWIDPLSLGILYIGLGEHNRALDYIEEAARVHSPWAVFIKRAPPFYVLRGNPRYEKLLLEMKLP